MFAISAPWRQNQGTKYKDDRHPFTLSRAPDILLFCAGPTSHAVCGYKEGCGGTRDA